jgi:hypothetical protein
MLGTKYCISTDTCKACDCAKRDGSRKHVRGRHGSRNAVTRVFQECNRVSGAVRYRKSDVLSNTGMALK